MTKLSKGNQEKAGDKQDIAIYNRRQLEVFDANARVRAREKTRVDVALACCVQEHSKQPLASARLARLAAEQVVVYVAV